MDMDIQINSLSPDKHLVSLTIRSNLDLKTYLFANVSL
jgi:hypothetical protein